MELNTIENEGWFRKVSHQNLFDVLEDTVGFQYFRRLFFTCFFKSIVDRWISKNESNIIPSNLNFILFHCTALHCTNRTSHAHWRFLFCLLITEKLRCQLDRRPLNLHQFCLTKRFQIVIRPRKKTMQKASSDGTENVVLSQCSISCRLSNLEFLLLAQ